MKKQWISNKITIVVMRGAHQSVKQIHLHKLLLVAVPLLLAAAIALLASMLYVRTASLTALTAEKSAFDTTLAQKEEEIDRLQNEVLQLTALTDEVEHRMNRIAQMESQLQQFVNEYGNPKEYAKSSGTVRTSTSSPNVSALSGASSSAAEESPLPGLSPLASRWDATDNVGGEFREATSAEIVGVAKETGERLRNLQTALSLLDENIPVTLQKVLHMESLLKGIPTQWPTESTRLTSLFGYRKDPFKKKAAYHSGIDIGGSTGDPIYAAADGIVTETGFSNSRGRYIVIKHPSGLSTRYFHLYRIETEANAKVSKGDPIGQMGSSGRSTGTHLHFEVLEKDTPIDPLPFLERLADIAATADTHMEHE